MVVGVADASAKDPLASRPEELRAWGLHLSFGALYTKHAGSMKGSLSTKQLVPACALETPDDDPEAGHFVDGVTDFEVEVDLHRRRLAFGLAGTPLVDAPVKISGAVRPWVYLWNEMDSVQLLSRYQPREGSGGSAGTGRLARTLIKRDTPTASAPVPLRARLAEREPPLGPPLSPAAYVRVPTHFDRGAYVPPYMQIDRTPAEARASARKTAREVTTVLKSARHAVALAAQE